MIDRARQSGHRDNRAVSDVLAFILVFSIIITSVGLVYVFGMGALGDAQVSEQNRNAERAFETLSVSFNDLQTGRGQERMSQLNPRGGQIRVDDSLAVEVTEDGGGTLKNSDAGSLEYSHEGTTVSYELGAVFRADDGHSVMVREPEFVCSNSETGPDRSIVSYPMLTPGNPASVSSSSTLRVRATRPQEKADLNRSDGNVTVEIENSAHADAWARYFKEEGWLDIDEPSGKTGTVKATCESDATTVRETEIEVDLL